MREHTQIADDEKISKMPSTLMKKEAKLLIKMSEIFIV